MTNRQTSSSKSAGGLDSLSTSAAQEEKARDQQQEAFNQYFDQFGAPDFDDEGSRTGKAVGQHNKGQPSDETATVASTVRALESENSTTGNTGRGSTTNVFLSQISYAFRKLSTRGAQLAVKQLSNRRNRGIARNNPPQTTTFSGIKETQAAQATTNVVRLMPLDSISATYAPKK